MTLRNEIYSSAPDRLIAKAFRAQNKKGIGPVIRVLLYALGIDTARVPAGDGLKLVHASNGIVLHERTTLGRNVTVFHGVTVGRSDPWVALISRDDSETGVTIEDDVIIGAHASILFSTGQRVVIGQGAIIGTGALVNCSVPAGEIWAGTPAKRIGTR